MFDCLLDVGSHFCDLGKFSRIGFSWWGSECLDMFYRNERGRLVSFLRGLGHCNWDIWAIHLCSMVSMVNGVTTYRRKLKGVCSILYRCRAILYRWWAISCYWSYYQGTDFTWEELSTESRSSLRNSSRKRRPLHVPCFFAQSSLLTKKQQEEKGEGRWKSLFPFKSVAMPISWVPTSGTFRSNNIEKKKNNTKSEIVCNRGQAFLTCFSVCLFCVCTCLGWADRFAEWSNLLRLCCWFR